MAEFLSYHYAYFQCYPVASELALYPLHLDRKKLGSCLRTPAKLAVVS